MADPGVPVDEPVALGSGIEDLIDALGGPTDDLVPLSTNQACTVFHKGLLEPLGQLLCTGQNIVAKPSEVYSQIGVFWADTLSAVRGLPEGSRHVPGVGRNLEDDVQDLVEFCVNVIWRRGKPKYTLPGAPQGQVGSTVVKRFSSIQAAMRKGAAYEAQQAAKLLQQQQQQAAQYQQLQQQQLQMQQHGWGAPVQGVGFGPQPQGQVPQAQYAPPQPPLPLGGVAPPPLAGQAGVGLFGGMPGGGPPLGGAQSPDLLDALLNRAASEGAAGQPVQDGSAAFPVGGGPFVEQAQFSYPNAGGGPPQGGPPSAFRWLMTVGVPCLRVEKLGMSLLTNCLRAHSTLTAYVEARQLPPGRPRREALTLARIIDLGVAEMGEVYARSGSCEVAIRRLMAVLLAAKSGEQWGMASLLEELPGETALAEIPDSVLKSLGERLKLESKVTAHLGASATPKKG